jgi:hypothetical protein
MTPRPMYSPSFSAQPTSRSQTSGAGPTENELARSRSNRSCTSKTSWRSRDPAYLGWQGLTEPAGQTVFELPTSRKTRGNSQRAPGSSEEHMTTRFGGIDQGVRPRVGSRGHITASGEIPRDGSLSWNPHLEEESEAHGRRGLSVARGNAGLESGPPLGATPWSRANTSRGARKRQEGPRSR